MKTIIRISCAFLFYIQFPQVLFAQSVLDHYYLNANVDFEDSYSCTPDSIFLEKTYRTRNDFTNHTVWSKWVKISSDKSSITLADTLNENQIPFYIFMKYCNHGVESLLMRFENGNAGITYDLGSIPFKDAEYSFLESMHCKQSEQVYKLCIDELHLARTHFDQDGMIMFNDYYNWGKMNIKISGRIHPTQGKTGEWKHFLPDGFCYMTEEYQNNKLNGIQKVYLINSDKYKKTRRLKKPVEYHYIDNEIIK